LPRYSPRESVDRFLAAWRDENWELARKYIQRSYPKRSRWRPDDRLLAYTLHDTLYTMTDYCVDIPARLEFDDRTHDTLVRVIREGRDGRPNSEGEWGVNPVSTYRVRR
jgi:hypothetical protein